VPNLLFFSSSFYLVSYAQKKRPEKQSQLIWENLRARVPPSNSVYGMTNPNSLARN
jgi:hypothetical protein